MRLQERLRWFARLALAVFILVAAAFLSAILAIRLAIHGREVVVPNVVGMKAGDAQAGLAARGLGMKIADRAYSELPVDHVVRQSPAAGAHVKVNQQAHVVLSLGRQQVTIPPLEGKSVRAARIELLQAGLQVGEISTLYLPGYLPDQVVQQDPGPRASNAAGPRVNLLVSLGRREPAYVMPDLVGLSLVEVQRRLTGTGTRIGKITFTSSTKSPRGSVVAQTLPRGARLVAGATVDLEIAE